VRTTPVGLRSWHLVVHPRRKLRGHQAGIILRRDQSSDQIAQLMDGGQDGLQAAIRLLLAGSHLGHEGSSAELMVVS
jgi:hypothetical protein